MYLIDQKLPFKSSFNLYAGFPFSTKYRSQNVPLTYMWIDLYESIYGIYLIETLTLIKNQFVHT
jgi:hypothetical protein